jgi:hypothetical protein
MQMKKLNHDGTVDLNAMAERITAQEAGAKEVDIAQTKQIMKLVAKDLLEIRDEHGNGLMEETVKRLAE